MKRVAIHCLWACALSPVFAPSASAEEPAREVYRCPGNPVLYTDTISAKEARDKGCRTLEGSPITVVQSVRPRAANPVAAAPGVTRSSEGNPEQRVDPNQQRARDSDARRILEGELRREEERLVQLQKDFNGGEPERQGDERNYQKYLDRVAEMKAGIARKQSDIAAIKRELAKLPQ